MDWLPYDNLFKEMANRCPSSGAKLTILIERLILYAQSLGAPKEVAEDVVSDAVIGVYELVDRGRDVNYPVGYLYRAVRNNWFAFRKFNRRFIGDLESWHLIDNNTPESILEKAEDQEIIKDLPKQLTAAERQAFEYYMKHPEHHHRQAGTALGIHPSAYRAAKSRAVRHLSHLYERIQSYDVRRSV